MWECLLILVLVCGAATDYASLVMQASLCLHWIADSLNFSGVVSLLYLGFAAFVSFK